MNYVTVFNAIELVLWGSLGLGCAIRAANGKGPRTRLSLAAVGFLAFAGSDAVEIQTGAWWRPWWLFVWKACCVVLLVGLAVQYFRRRKGQSVGTDQSPSEKI